MIGFWLLSILMLLVAFGFVLYPLFFRPKQGGLVSRPESNIALFRQRLSELERSYAAQDIAEPEYQQLKLEYQRALLSDADNDKRAMPAVTAAVNGKYLIVGFAAITGLLTYLVYYKQGQIDDWHIVALLEEKALQTFMARSQGKPVDTEAVSTQLVDKLTQRLAQHPDKLQHWFLLAQAYMEQTEYSAAADAYEKILAIEPGNSEVMGFYAQALFMATNRITPAVKQAIDSALAVDPNNVTVLGLVGIAAYEAQDYAMAINVWQKILGIIPPQSPNAAYIQQGISRAKSMLSQQGAGTTPLPTPDKAIVSLKVSVSMSDALSADPSDVVFVYARPMDGRRMPVAIKKIQVADLPANVILDDSSAAMPTQKLSDFDQVELVARVSQDGSAITKPGDLQGVSAAVNVRGIRDPVSLHIDTVVP